MTALVVLVLAASHAVPAQGFLKLSCASPESSPILIVISLSYFMSLKNHVSPKPRPEYKHQSYMFTKFAEHHY